MPSVIVNIVNGFLVVNTFEMADEWVAVGYRDCHGFFSRCLSLVPSIP